MLHNHLYMHMCGMHMSVFGIETNPVPELCVRCVSVCECVCVFWNVPGLIGRLRNAEYYLSPGEAGLECGPILLSAVTCRFTLHTSPGWLHFQFRAQFHSFTRTCVLAAGVEASFCVPICAHAQKSLDVPFWFVHLSLYFMDCYQVICIFQPNWNFPGWLPLHPSPLKITTQTLL